MPDGYLDKSIRGSRMNVETLDKAELLMLLSILEGELEAQDVVIHTLRVPKTHTIVAQMQAQQKEAFVQERYGLYDLRDPFVALLRDSELSQAEGDGEQDSVHMNPLGVLRLVMAHCTNMKEKMAKQLAATEKRHRRVIADLEEEKRWRVQDAAAGDDITAMLEKEQERLLQQLELERAQVERLQRERSVLTNQAEEDLAEQQQLSSTLAQECQKATARAEEESQRVIELTRQLEQERITIESLKGELESKHSHAQQIEARAERQLAEFDTEREQMRGKLRKEEKKYQELQEQLNSLRKELGEMNQREKAEKDNVQEEKAESPAEERNKEGGLVDNVAMLPGGGGASQCLSPSSPASSSLSSSPCSSPVLTKRLTSLGCSSPTYPSSYQASINQRFQAARHKFQAQAEAENHGTVVHSPRDLSPTAATPPSPDNSSAKQIARNTVTQVLSRFTSQQAAGKHPTSNSSPYGTDYRNLSTASSPTGKSPVLSPGIRSPVIPRAEKIHPSTVSLKKQGVNQSPNSPVLTGRASHFPELSGGCGLTSSQEDTKELDLVILDS
ncbi:CTTNBP2 N-terminal-like protein [Triplophysa tibetana]|uniref:CTTNBP2 N-terminal-like protein n=1 Tax=Triplophysa tibetana TaxID=1572043 RepID=A0A5A9NVX9_9TELE|nr:CTTNBP2 N-terminal-like protein [Triplophysa tibetana]